MSNFVIARSGWKSPASVWTVRSGNLATGETSESTTTTTNTTYNIWTDLAVSVSAGGKEGNCRLLVAHGRLLVEMLSDVPEGGLIVLNKDYSTNILQDFLPVDYPLDLSSPLFFSLHNQKISSDLIFR